MTLIRELNRRNVLRVGAAYLVVAWLLIQVAETIFPLFGFDDTPARIVVIALAIGFVPALVFAWVFELTPEGLKRESDIDRSQSITPQTGRKLDRIIMVVLALALSYFAFDKFVLEPQRLVALERQQAEQIAEVAEAALQQGRSQALVEAYGDQSIAVLAFQDMSQEQDQEYLSDGIAEELLNLLASIPELRVISRSSSFRYKGKDIALTQIAKELDVAHILEGSVRKSGKQVRITAQLIDARTDTHLWSNTYDRTLDDIFAIQDDIAATVVEQLKVTLLGPAPRAQSADPEAYALYLHARHLGRLHTPEAWAQSNELSDQAIQIDPSFAAPWSNKATNYVNMTSIGIIGREEGLALAREAVARALELDPEYGLALSSAGWIAMAYDQDLAAAARYYQKALAVAPTDYSIVANSATLLLYLRRYEESIKLREFATPRNPLSAVTHLNFSSTYLAVGRLDEAESELRTTLRLSPKFYHAHLWLGKVLLLKGQPQMALDVILQSEDEKHRLTGQALCQFALGNLAGSDQALGRLIDEFAGVWSYEIASILAWRNEADRAFEWLDRAVADGDPALGEPPYNPFFAKIEDDPRWAAFMARIGKSQEQLDAIEFRVTLPRGNKLQANP